MANREYKIPENCDFRAIKNNNFKMTVHIAFTRVIAKEY